MVSQWLVSSITKNATSYLLFLGQQPFTAFQIQYFQWSIPIYLRIIRNLFNLKLFL